jgi:2-dehydro-3-deoxygluconokinase
MSHVQVVSGARMGVIYVEFGVEPRPGLHLYDRQGSAASTISVDDFDWPEIIQHTRLAYTDGIFPGLGDGCRKAALAFVRAARQAGRTVCFDMNYRETIWSREQAREVYREILPSVGILVTNRAVSELLLAPQQSDEDIAWWYRKEFGCQTVCVTSRQMAGFGRGAWKSLTLHQDQITYGRPFEFDVVDRFGTGDAFFAGFLYGLAERDVKFALDFGNAICALSHTVEGDVAAVSVDEVMALLNGPSDFQIRR